MLEYPRHHIGFLNRLFLPTFRHFKLSATLVLFLIYCDKYLRCIGYPDS